METLLFLGVLALVAYATFRRRRSPRASQQRPLVYSGTSSDELRSLSRLPDDASTLMYSPWPHRQAELEAATNFLWNARQKLAKRQTARLLNTDHSTAELDREFASAWDRITAAACAQYGDKTTGVALLRLGF